MATSTDTIQELANREYKYGFVTDIEADAAPRGLNEDIIRLISAKKNEPRFHAGVAAEGLPALADAWRSRNASRSGRTSTIRRSTTRTSSTTRRRSRRNGRRAWTRSTRSCWRRTRSWASRWRSRSASPASRSMRCSTASRWRPRSRRSSPSWGSSSAPSPRRCRSIRTWCRSTSGRWCPTPTTSSRR